MSRLCAFLFALALAGSVSCGSRTPVAPEPTLDLRMEVTASSQGVPGQPVDVLSVVRNAGDLTVGQLNVCPDPVIRIYDGQNVELLQRDPTVDVVCPAWMLAPLESGMSVEFRHTFDGTYFSLSGQRLDAPPGTYRAVATFEYMTIPDPGGTGERGELTRDVVFDWR